MVRYILRLTDARQMLDDVGITTTLDQTLITATSQMFSFACSVGFAFLPARVGRRPLL